MGFDGMEGDYSLLITKYMLILLVVVLVLNKMRKMLVNSKLVTFIIYFIGAYLLHGIAGKVLGRPFERGSRRGKGINLIGEIRDQWEDRNKR